jgi:predicted transcriptional regulator
MDVYYDNFKKGKNVHKLHDYYSYSENTGNANCACKPCEKPILYQILE